MDIDKNTQHIKQIIDALRKEKKLKKGLDKARVKELWQQLMSDTIAGYTHNISFQNGTLKVYLTSAPLREELNRGKDKIVKLLNEELGENLIQKIIFK